ncbi:LANO_0F04082g1_1 [Lachancea nothofagi CBS 11611]|uniref:LANO_0F04082g1_1 n=1 Tax=Lachancea nothofagi CBS 11611 TaxID=1266666 RepID=A0A1G4K7E2_9SACH|nr:LANO_0F04082g1_1 [Lachancea nothofagi CBS 11611]
MSFSLRERMRDSSSPVHKMVRRVLHTLRSTQLPSARMVAKVLMPLIAIVAAVVIYIQASKLGQYSKLSQYTPEYMSDRRNEEPDWFDSSTFYSTRVDPVQGKKFSPLELLPGYDKDMISRRQKSWDFLGRKHRFKKFEELSTEAKCLFYFHKVYELTPNWSNDYKKWDFIINDDEMLNLQDVDEASSEAIKSRKRENDMALGIERARMYDLCFVSPAAANVDMAKILQKQGRAGGSSVSEIDQWDFEHRMWPMLRKFNATTFEDLIPRITNPQGEILEKGFLPPMGKKREASDVAVKYQYDGSRSFLWNWNQMSSRVSPRGIVLSFGDAQLELASKFLAHMRFTGNTLPIQVVTKGDVSRETIEILLKMAQADTIDFPKTDYKNAKNVKQELWFLDVSPTLDPDVKDSFDRFKNKWLAASFNLFQEYAFIDIDAVNYVDMNYFFDNTDYRITGTLFFKDRFLNEVIDHKCPAMLETLAPRFMDGYYMRTFSAIQPDHVEFACEKWLSPAELTYRDFFFFNKKHQMDSGLVVVDKDSHSVPLMISMMMHLTPKLNSCSYGDKEFFWLGFQASGHQFSFHKSRPGATGMVRDEPNVNKQMKQRKSEICSIIISHISPRDGLLWVNGGTQNCKFDVARKDWDDDNLHMSAKYSSFEDMEKQYKGPVDMHSGIIPAEKPDVWGKPDQRCKGYYYCARYEQHIKPYSFNKKYEKGQLITFSSEQREKYNAINKVWVTNYLS